MTKPKSHDSGQQNEPFCMPKEAETIFWQTVLQNLSKDGTLEIKCPKGLFAVSGADHAAVEREAMRYWAQYFMNGEYRDEPRAFQPRFSAKKASACGVGQCAELRFPTQKSVDLRARTHRITA